MNAKYRLAAVLLLIIFIIWKVFQYKVLPKQDEPVQVVEQAEPHKDTVEKVKVTVYYESMCSDSRNFVVRHLLPTYTSLGEHIELDLVPYGKAQTIEVGGNLEFKCQHTEVECKGNKLHACAIEQISDPMLQLKMVACMIDDGLIPIDAAERCAHEYGVSFTQLKGCARGKRGSILLKAHGERTDAVRPSITFIPTIELDGEQKVPLPKLLKDFKRELCGLYRETPSGCS